VRGKPHPGYKPALERERVRLEQLGREMEHETAFKHAFWRALVAWTKRHANDDTSSIVIPTGQVDGRELAHVVCALLRMRVS
jgi:hypothetical protein